MSSKIKEGFSKNPGINYYTRKQKALDEKGTAIKLITNRKINDIADAIAGMLCFETQFVKSGKKMYNFQTRSRLDAYLITKYYLGKKAPSLIEICDIFERLVKNHILSAPHYCGMSYRYVYGRPYGVMYNKEGFDRLSSRIRGILVN